MLLAMTLTTGAQLKAMTQSLPTDSVVRAILKPRVDAGQFAGIAVGLVARDNQRRVIAYGPAAGVTPFDGNTVFEIGSITKTFTAAILADMVKRHEVELSDPVTKHLPAGTKIPERGGKQITLLDLATQRSGLPRMPDNMHPKDTDNPYADYTAAQMYAFLSTHMLPRDPGAAYEYSNLGFGLLGEALSFRAGMSYDALVTARVLTPLGMKDTRIALTPAMKQRLAPGHTDQGTVTKNWDLPTFAGAGALRSTVNDMLTYIRANADSMSAPLGRTLAVAHVERRPAGPPQTTIGLAWHRTKTPSGRTIVWHNGGTGGYRSFTGYDESTGNGVVVLTNTAQGVDEIGIHLLDPTSPLPPVPTVRAAIVVADATLERYVGNYELAPTFSIAITRNGSRMFAQATNQAPFEIFAEREDAFFVKVIDAQISFVKDANGNVTGLVLHQNGQNVPGKKK